MPLGLDVLAGDRGCCVTFGSMAGGQLGLKRGSTSGSSGKAVREAAGRVLVHTAAMSADGGAELNLRADAQERPRPRRSLPGATNSARGGPPLVRSVRRPEGPLGARESRGDESVDGCRRGTVDPPFPSYRAPTPRGHPAGERRAPQNGVSRWGRHRSWRPPVQPPDRPSITRQSVGERSPLYRVWSTTAIGEEGPWVSVCSRGSTSDLGRAAVNARWNALSSRNAGGHARARPAAAGSQQRPICRRVDTVRPAGRPAA